MFDLRLRQYTPGGAAGGILTTLTINANPLDSDLSSLSFQVSDRVLATLPNFLEVALEYWNETAWVESRNGRFLANLTGIDRKDPASIRTLTAVNYWLWMAVKTSLKGVAPYSESGKSATHDLGLSNASSAGTTVTKTAHGFIDGDAIVMTAKPSKMATLVPKVVYYVGSATANTFKVLGSRNGGAKVLGTWVGIYFKRVDDKISSASTQFVNNDLVTFTNVGVSPNLRTDSSYRVVQKDSTGFKVSAEVGGDPIDIVEGAGATVTGLALYRELDGDRQLSGTPGVILKTMIDEAQTRGWGVDLSYDFTATLDSEGVAWSGAQALQFAPGTSIKAALDRLVTMGLCEYSTSGRTLRVWNAATHGTDRSTGATPVRVGVNASAVPVKSSLDNLVTDLTVQGEGNLLLELHSASAPTDLGRLEQFQSLNGVLDTATLTLSGQNTLKLGEKINHQYTVTESAASAVSLPGMDYEAGDWVQARVGDTWESQRVAELVMSKDSKGVIDVSLVLNTRFIELLARLARKRAAETGGVSIGGNGTTRPGKDKRHPKAPAGLVAESLAGWNANGAAFTTISATWGVVTQATDSTSIDVASYELWVRGDGDATSTLVGSGKSTAMSAGPFQPGTDYYVKVRAKSSAGIFGPFTAEVGLTTTLPIEPLDPPTPPVGTAKLGTVRLAWDGLLDSGDAQYFPPPEFAYVWTGMSTTEAGTYTPVGGNLGHIGAVTVVGLSLGDVRWFKFYAVDRLGVASPPSAAVSVTVVGVKGPDLEANSVTANSIEAGAVQAEHISLGAVLPTGGPQNRVPAPLTDVGYWSMVKSGLISLNYIPGATVTPTVDGILVTDPGSGRSAMSITALLPIPATRKVTVSYVQSIAGGISVFHYDAAGAYVTGAGTPSGVAGMDTFTAPAGATHYRVVVLRDAGDPPVTVAACSVFEVIGGKTGQQSAELFPGGLRLVSDNGSGQVELTTNTNQFLGIYKDTGVGYEPQAFIDSDGGAMFQDLEVNNDIQVRGAQLLGDFEAVTRNGAVDDAAIIDRTARGVVLSGYFTQGDGTTTAAFRGLASFSFEATDARRYQLQIDSQMVGVNNGTGGTAEVEVLLSSSPIALNATTGYDVLRNEVWSISTATKPCLALVKSFDVNATASSNSSFKAGTNYILIRSTCTGTGASITLGVGSVPKHTVAVLDVGPEFDSFFNFTNNATSGTPSSTASSRTATFACAWSRSWNNNGGSIVSGSSQYTDANMLYQGYGASAMGAMFGWSSLGLSAKTISKVEIYLRNRHTYSSGGVTVRFGTSTAGYTVPASHSSANAWTKAWGKGVGQWVTVPSSLWAGIGAGTIRSVALGISGSGGDYAYFDGVSKSDPPRIRVTYK